MEERTLEILKQVKQRFSSEGFVLLGYFGSRARGDHTPESDLDLLYRLEPEFYQLHRGWEAAGRLEEIRAEIEELVKLNIDMANRDALRPVGRKYILPETIYVA